MKRIRGARAVGALALVALSCALPAARVSAAPDRPAARAGTAVITIKQNGFVNGFTPSKLIIARGTVVVVRNKDSMRHTMTSVAKNKAGNPLFNTALAPHATTTVKGIAGLAAGKYPFYCSIHPNMRGTLTVKGGPGGTSGSGPRFRQPLILPKVITGGSVHVPVEKARVRSLPTGKATPMWTFGGTYPGPTITETTGHATNVTFRDELPSSSGPLSIHLHGDHHASADDGLPALTTGGQHNVLLDPGGTRTYNYSLTDSAAPGESGFDFYHDHTMGRTARNNWNGLQGMFIVNSPREKKLHLPSGTHDLPLLVSDRSYTADHHLARFSSGGAPPNDSTIGTHILVNGRYLPYKDVTTHRYRLRLLNASDFQSYDFALSSGRRFRQIGTGDGLLPHAVMRKDILLGPAQRADVIVSFHGELHHRVVLESIPSTDHAPGAIGTPTAPIMQFRVTRKTSDHSKAPYHLEPTPPITVPTTVAQTWDFGLGGSTSTGTYWTVNGQPYDPSVVMHEVPLGATELWMLRNDSDMTHYIHLHEEAWHTIARIDANGVSHAPPPWEDGLEDTWRLDPGTAVEVAARFTDYTGVFMLHCHMLDHEDDGMMAQFAVVRPGDPQLPAGYRYQPLSGTHRPLTTAHPSMAGMDMGASAASTPHAAATAPAARAAPAAPVALPVTAVPRPAWYSTLVQLGRAVGVEAGVVLLVLIGVSVRRRRTRSSG